MWYITDTDQHYLFIALKYHQKLKILKKKKLFSCLFLLKAMYTIGNVGNIFTSMLTLFESRYTLGQQKKSPVSGLSASAFLI